MIPEQDEHPQILVVGPGGIATADDEPKEGAGRIVPVIDRTLPMSQAAQAHRVMAASAHIGKLLLLPG